MWPLKGTCFDAGRSRSALIEQLLDLLPKERTGETFVQGISVAARAEKTGQSQTAFQNRNSKARMVRNAGEATNDKSACGIFR